MDKTLKRYINDLMITMALGITSDSDDSFIKFSKIRLRMLNAVKNYSSLRLKLLQNKTINNVERQAVKQVARVALDSACKKYDIRLDDATKDKAVNECLEQLLEFIHNIRCDIFLVCISYCETGIKLYES